MKTTLDMTKATRSEQHGYPGTPWAGKETSPDRGQLILLDPQPHWIRAGSQVNFSILTM